MAASVSDFSSLPPNKTDPDAPIDAQMPPLNKILVIIPVCNEEATIAAVIEDLQAIGLSRIRVVDNGSRDRSAAIAQSTGAEVIYEPISGYGCACWRGLQDIPPEIEWILFCDGDGSDAIAQLPQFFARCDRHDFILGDRGATAQGRENLTSVQRFGNRLATFLIQLGWGYSYQDLGPLRLMRRSALEALKMQDRGFGWTVEMQVKAVEQQLHICEIPVHYYPRQGGRSKISGTIAGSLQAGTIILSTLGNLYFQRNLKRFTPPHFIFLWASVLLLAIGTIFILPYGDFRQVEAVPKFWGGIAVMSVGFVLSWRLRSLKATWFWGVAIALRLLLLFMYPGDDIWRYLWEGYLQNLGFSPYDLPPEAAELIPYRTDWWELINLKHFSAIYPPITQFGFRILASISPSVILFKFSFIISDLLICGLLSRKFGYVQTIVYAWNPLILYSFAGGGHYDSWFILPLVAAWLLFDANANNKNYLGTALLLGVSIAIKWTSLPILGFLLWQALKREGIQKAIAVLACGFLPLIIAGIPFCFGDRCPILPYSAGNSDFVIHGRSADFLPYFLQKWGFPLTDNSSLALPLLAIGLIMLWRIKSFRNFTETYFFILFIFSPIIHAWYFSWLVPFAVASRNLGTKLISMTVFIYFILQYRAALGIYDWWMNESARLFLWLPFVGGWCWSTIANFQRDRQSLRKEGENAIVLEDRL
ncbi:MULTISPECIES: glycosyltransferase family 2 protein [Spirulina sp. CCY15215]|uniref:glycosyltransferase family 2 protein n=1 Tax=Spirulina sp. CCY15215 TaxID=2767591 RepID=UPI00194EC549|nr:glycosyltransferase family 2 protein [Spirulina major]